MPGGMDINRLRQRLTDDGKQYPRCPSANNKVSYPDEKTAVQALVALRLRESTSPLRPERAEECTSGKHWHLVGGERVKCPLTGTSIYLTEEDALRGLALAVQRAPEDNRPTQVGQCGTHFHVISPQRTRCEHNNRVIFGSYESASEALRRISQKGGDRIKPTRVEPCPYGEAHFHLARRPIR
jgi:hypothetical protein